MEAFNVMYKVLKFLESAMKVEEFPLEQFNGASFRVSDQYFKDILKMLTDDGYVKGIVFTPILGQTGLGMKCRMPEITIKGLEYLQENSMMKKAANIAKGIIDVIS